MNSHSDKDLKMSENMERLKSVYVGNLKRERKFFSLEWFHFVMAAANGFGTLLKKYVLVQYIGCKINGEIRLVHLS